MHIAIDSSPLESGHKGRGVGVYTKNLIESLNKYESQHSYTLFTQKQNIPNTADIVHYPYFDPFFLTLPLIKKRPTLVTVHDVIPLVFPDKFPPGIRGTLRWNIQKLSLLGARRVIADSNTSKNDIARITKFPKQRIDTVYLAPTSVFNSKVDAAFFETVKNKYKLPKQYVTMVSDVNWNKNIVGLVEAFAQLHAEYLDVALVLVGKSFLNNTLPEVVAIHAAIARVHMQKAVILCGPVSDSELACIYANARCLVQPSHYEGFGLPVLEAFACGCPVVASDNSSLSEIAGPAILVQSRNISSIATGIRTILRASDKKRAELIKQGYDWVHGFTWKKVAHETVRSYELSLL